LLLALEDFIEEIFQGKVENIFLYISLFVEWKKMLLALDDFIQEIFQGKVQNIFLNISLFVD